MADILENRDAIVEKIMASTAKSREEIEKMIEDRKGKFAGLLTDAGAAFMIAKDFGVNLEAGETSEFTRVGSLQDGMQNVDLIVKVLQVFSPRKFEKKGRKGLLCNLLVGDETGEIRLTLWHKDAKRVQEEGIERGSTMMFKNCYVTSYNERKQLNLGYAGEMVANPEVAGKVSEMEVKSSLVKLDELNEGMNDVDVYGRVLRIYPATEFDKEGRKGRVVNFELGDATEKIRAAAWNDLAGEVEKIGQGDIVKIEGAYTKQGLKGIELNLGWKARIIKNPKIDFKIPEAAEFDFSAGKEIKLKKINELVAGDRFVGIAGKIVEVNRGNLHFNVCSKCGKKLERTEDGFSCSIHGTAEPDISAVVSVQLEDESGGVNIVFYAEQGEKIMGWGKNELKNKLKSEAVEDLLLELKERLVGKKAKVNGFVRADRMNPRETEFVGKEVEFLN